MAQRVRISHRGQVLRLPDNSPLRQHFTRDSYSVAHIIHHKYPNVNTFLGNKPYFIVRDQENPVFFSSGSPQKSA